MVDNNHPHIYVFPETAGPTLLDRPRAHLAFFLHEDDPFGIALLPSELNAALVIEEEEASPLRKSRAAKLRTPIGSERLQGQAQAPDKEVALIVTPLNACCQEEGRRQRIQFAGPWRHAVHARSGQHHWSRRCDTSFYQGLSNNNNNKDVNSAPDLMGLLVVGPQARTLANQHAVLLDTAAGSGCYTASIGGDYHLAFDFIKAHDTFANETGIGQLLASATLHYVPEATASGETRPTYTRVPLPALPEEDPQQEAPMAIGVNVNVYRSNYKTIREKAQREIVLAEATLSKTEDDLSKGEKALKNWRTLAIGEAKKEKEAQEAATAMTPEGLVSEPDSVDETVRERLERRIEETDTQLVEAATKLKTASTTLKKLKKQAGLYRAARRRRLIINRARGLRGLKIPRLEPKQGEAVIKRFQKARSQYKTLKKRRASLKEELTKVETERTTIYEEARTLAKERADRAEALREKREKADEADLDFKIQRVDLEQRRLEEAKRAREEAERAGKQAAEGREASLREQERQRELLEEQRREAEEQREAAEEQASEQERQRELLEEQRKAEEENRRLREEIDRLRRKQEEQEARREDQINNHVTVPGTAALGPLFKQAASLGAGNRGGGRGTGGGGGGGGGNNSSNSSSNSEMSMLRYELRRMKQQQDLDRLKQEEEKRMQELLENERRHKERDDELKRLARLESMLETVAGNKKR